jgi:hypothetical protein
MILTAISHTLLDFTLVTQSRAITLQFKVTQRQERARVIQEQRCLKQPRLALSTVEMELVQMVMRAGRRSGEQQPGLNWQMLKHITISLL